MKKVKISKRILISVLILLSLIFLVYILYSENVVFSSEEDVCPPTTKECRNGDSVACCQPGWECKKYTGFGRKIAWCSPTSESLCDVPQEFLCKGKKSNTCCTRVNEECTELRGHARCDYNDSICEKSGGTTCGNNPTLCCRKGQSCKNIGFGVSACNSQKCPKNQELCSGKDFNICCNSGQCISSTTGLAHCADGEYNPLGEWPEPSDPNKACNNPNGATECIGKETGDECEGNGICTRIGGDPGLCACLFDKEKYGKT